jgi:hypothetical protein
VSTTLFLIKRNATTKARSHEIKKIAKWVGRANSFPYSLSTITVRLRPDSTYQNAARVHENQTDRQVFSYLRDLMSL